MVKSPTHARNFLIPLANLLWWLMIRRRNNLEAETGRTRTRKSKEIKVVDVLNTEVHH